MHIIVRLHVHACVPQVEPCCCCDYCGDQKHRPPRCICHHLFPEGVGGRGRMKGGREWEKEEGEGRRKSRRADDGKMATPVGPYARCFERVTLCRSLQMLNSISLFPKLVLYITRVSSSPFLNVSLSLISSHFSTWHERSPLFCTHTGRQSCQTTIKRLCGRCRVGGHFDFQVYLISCVHTSALAGGQQCGQVIWAN